MCCAKWNVRRDWNHKRRFQCSLGKQEAIVCIAKVLLQRAFVWKATMVSNLTVVVGHCGIILVGKWEPVAAFDGLVEPIERISDILGIRAGCVTNVVVVSDVDCGLEVSNVVILPIAFGHCTVSSRVVHRGAAVGSITMASATRGAGTERIISSVNTHVICFIASIHGAVDSVNTVAGSASTTTVDTNVSDRAVETVIAAGASQEDVLAA